MDTAPPPRRSLDGVHVSFVRISRHQQSLAGLSPGELRAIHWSERRRQDHDDGHHHRKTNRTRAPCLFDGVTDLTRLDETRIGRTGIGGNSRSRRCSRARPSKTIC